MQTILMIEDNPDIMKINRTILEKQYNILEATTLMKGEALLKENNPDLILLDIMLPDGSGLDFCERIRNSSDSNANNIPILFITALGENTEIVEGFTRGGDDYITKPYDLDVLSARIEALLRRTTKFDKEPITVEGLEIGYMPNKARLNGRDLRLTPREFSLLEYLLKNHGEFVPSKTLYEKIWGMTSTDSRPVKQHIHNIRKKLGENSPVIIEASQGKGYCLTKK